MLCIPDQGFDGFHAFAKVANSFQGCNSMGLNRCSKPDDTCRAQDHVVDKSKSKQCGEEPSENERDGIVKKESQSSDQGKTRPERSEDHPTCATCGGDRLNVVKIETLVAFDQYELLDEQEVVRPQIQLGSQTWNQGHEQAAIGNPGVRHGSDCQWATSGRSQCSRPRTPRTK